MSQIADETDLLEEVRIASCRYVVDAVHPTCGSTFLYYCFSDASEGFYVALCDERSKNKKEPVKRKALDVVKRIDTIVIQKRVIRNQRCTFLSSAHSSRSASCATSIDALHGTEPTQLEEWWCNVLLALCVEATGETSTKPPSLSSNAVSSFTTECQRCLHAPDDVRRWYQWALCCGSTLPIHLSLRQLEMTQSPSVDHSPNTEFDPQESFTAYCDPLVVPQTVKQHQPSNDVPLAPRVLDGVAPATPRRDNELHAADVLSPMTPPEEASSTVSQSWYPPSSGVSYAQRNIQIMHAFGKVLRTPAVDGNHIVAHEAPMYARPKHVRRWDASYL